MSPPLLQRRFERLLDGPFDLLVVGGGIHGAWAAYDAAMRGLRVAIVEQEDWAAGSSSATSKRIHGGLADLEHRAFGAVRTALDERGRLARLAPHQVRPLRVALPTRVGQRRGRLRVRMGLALYDRLAGRDRPVPPYAAFDRAAFAHRYGFLRAGDLRGGFSYGDYVVDDARLVLEVVAAAVHFGAVAVNRAPVERLLVAANDSRVVGAEVRDRETGATIKLTAAVTLNCAGSWQNRIEGGDPSPVRLTKSVHAVLPALPTDDALALPGHDGRVVFALPWYERTLLGATDTEFRGTPGFARATPREVAWLLAAADRHLDIGWEERDVIASFAGLRVDPAGDEARLVNPAPGLLASLGGRLTTARLDAARAVDLALERLGRPAVAAPTDDRRLPWAPDGPYDEFRAGAISRGLGTGLDEEVAARTADRYGTRVTALHELLAERPALARRLVADAPFCRGEVTIAVRDEMARTLTDVLRRRMPLLLVSRMERAAVEQTAQLAGEVLNWAAERRQAEVEAIVRPHTNAATTP